MRELQRERGERERECPVSALILHRKTLWHTQRCFKRSHLTPFRDTLFALILYYLSSPWNTLELHSALKGQELAQTQNIYSAKLLQIWARYMSHSSPKWLKIASQFSSHCTKYKRLFCCFGKPLKIPNTLCLSCRQRWRIGYNSFFMYCVEWFGDIKSLVIRDHVRELGTKSIPNICATL